MAPRQLTVQSGAAALNVLVWDGDGPTILALHPGVGDSRIWRWCAPVWAASGYQIVAYDRRGFGSTRYRPEPHDDLADLLAVLDDVHHSRRAERVGRTGNTPRREPVFVVGNSMGGGLAADLALAEPRRVAAMVLAAPSLSGYDYSDWPTAPAEAAQDELLVAAADSGDNETVSRLEVRYWLDGVDQPEGRVSGEARELMLEMNAIALASEPTGEAESRRSAWLAAPEIEAPTLVTVGEHDLPGVRTQCEQLIELLPDSRVEVMTDSAHCPALDRPAEFGRLVVDFFGSVDLLES